MILDNVLATLETIHCLKRRGKCSKKKLALKLDMTKVYDLVERAYLERMLLMIDFLVRFVTLVMNYVTLVSYFFLSNGKPHGEINLSQGIRQGIPYPHNCS